MTESIPSNSHTDSLADAPGLNSLHPQSPSAGLGANTQVPPTDTIQNSGAGQDIKIQVEDQPPEGRGDETDLIPIGPSHNTEGLVGTQGADMSGALHQGDQQFSSDRPVGIRARRSFNEINASGKLDTGRKRRQQEEDGIRKKKANEEINVHKSAPVSYKSKRKVLPQQPSQLFGNYNPEERLSASENPFNECHPNTTKKNPKKTTPQLVQQTTSSWIYRQFFYSNYEKPYYEQSDFKELLETIGLKDEPVLIFGDFKSIQKSLGPVRLFTSTFIQEQRLGLEDIRQLSRSYSRTQSASILTERLQNSTSIPYFEKVSQLKVGNNVLAVANCGHMHMGMILGQQKGNLLVVKFYNLNVGIQKIPDHSVSSEYSFCKHVNHRQFQPSETFSQVKANDLVQNVDFFSVSLFFKALIAKSTLLNKLHQLNIKIVKSRQTGQIPPQELLNYTRLVQLLDMLNRYMRPMMSAFRLRGVSSYRKQEIAKSMKKLLISPLNFMQKELQADIDETDHAAIKQINGILQNQQENKVQQLTRVLVSNLHCQGAAFDGEQGLLVKNCLSILVSMKMENRPCTLVDNKYMRNISTVIYNHFGEELNQISSCIDSICLR